MTKRITALLLSLCMLLSAAPVFAGAATGQQVTANAVTVTAGNTASVTLKAENFTGLAALDVYIYYDPAVFTVSGTTNGTILSSAQVSVNTAVAGEITMSSVSLNPMTGSGNLLTVRFATKAGATPGTYPITVAIGRAFDGNFAPATVGSVSGSVTVTKPVETEKFSIYGYTSASTMQKGGIQSYRVASASSTRAFVSGEFTVEYDQNIFAFDSVTLESPLTGEGALYSINSGVPGQVRIAYANDKPVMTFYLFTVKLKVIADVDTQTTLYAKAENMYREDLSAYLPSSWSNSVTIKKLPVVEDHPNAFFTTDRLMTGQKSRSVFALEAGAGVAAADFAITYDPTVLRCTAVTMAAAAEEKGGMVIINDNFGNGTIRFSYVNMDAYDDTDLPLVEITWQPIQSPKGHYQVTATAEGVVDSNQNLIMLDFPPDSNCIFVRETTNGKITNTCACGNAFADPIALKSMNMQLGSSMSLNLNGLASVLDQYENVYVVFQPEGGEPVKVSKYFESISSDGTLRYNFAYEGLTILDLNLTINYTIYGTFNGKEYSSQTKTISLLTYCRNSITRDTPNAAVPCANLLKYAIAAEAYMKTQMPELDESKFIINVLTEAEKAKLEQYAYADEQVNVSKTSVVKQGSQVQFRSQALDMVSRITMLYKMAIPSNVDKTKLTFKVEYNDMHGNPMSKSYTFEDLVYETQTGYYVLKFSEFNASQMRDGAKCIIYIDGVEHGSYQNSIENYCYTAINKAGESELVKNLAKRISLYGDACYEAYGDK